MKLPNAFWIGKVEFRDVPFRRFFVFLPLWCARPSPNPLGMIPPSCLNVFLVSKIQMNLFDTSFLQCPVNPNWVHSADCCFRNPINPWITKGEFPHTRSKGNQKNPHLENHNCCRRALGPIRKPHFRVLVLTRSSRSKLFRPVIALHKNPVPVPAGCLVLQNGVPCAVVVWCGRWKFSGSVWGSSLARTNFPL